jgi:hypothetical protein
MTLDDLKEGRVITKQNIDQYSRFLKPTIPEGQLKDYNPLMPTVGKELSTGNIFREDILGHIMMLRNIHILLSYGQLGLYKISMMIFQGELKLTMSIDGKFMEQIATNKFEYSQEQHVYEHQLPEEKRPRKKILGIF